MKRPLPFPCLSHLQGLRQWAAFGAVLIGLFVFLAALQTSNDEWLEEKELTELEEVAAETFDVLEAVHLWHNAVVAAILAKCVCNCQTCHDLTAERRANTLPTWVWKASRTEAYCQWQLEC